MDETPEPFRTEEEQSDGGAHGSRVALTKPWVCPVHGRTKNSTAALRAPRFPPHLAHGHHSRALGRGHSLTFSGSLSHTNLSPRPRSHLSCLTKNFLLTPTHRLNPSAPGAGCWCSGGGDLVRWGPWSQRVSHHRKAAVTRRRTVVATRDPPEFSLLSSYTTLPFVPWKSEQQQD